MNRRTLLSPGEFRIDLLKLFDPAQAMDVLLSAPGSLGPFQGMGAIHAAPAQRLAVSMSPPSLR